MNSRDKLRFIKDRMNKQARDAPPANWISRAERILIAWGAVAIALMAGAALYMAGAALYLAWLASR